MRLRSPLQLALPLFALALTGCGGGSSSSETRDGSSGPGAEGGVDGGRDSVASEAASGDSAGKTDGAKDGATGGDGGLFAGCSLSGGCLVDCARPAIDPIATGVADQDQYDGCILAAMKVAGMTDTWKGRLLKAQADQESGLVPQIGTTTAIENMCGGQNCGPWAISAGSISGDPAGGPCGVASDADWSHSFGLWQSTPACEGTFLQPTLPSGDACTHTLHVNNIPFGSSVTFYCETQTVDGVMTPTGTNKGYINAVQATTSPLYATSIFNPAYQAYVYIDYSWEINFAAANMTATGCTEMQQWYLSLAYWNTGDVTTTCTPESGDGGLAYVQGVLSNYQSLYGSAWPYPGP
jgi:hypothetical protein